MKKENGGGEEVNTCFYEKGELPLKCPGYPLSGIGAPVAQWVKRWRTDLVDRV